MVLFINFLMVSFSLFPCIFFFKKKEKNHELDASDSSDRLLCRFVVDGYGRSIGESVAIDQDLLIVKSKRRFLGVPLKHAEEVDSQILIKGLVDLKGAYELGEMWQQESLRKEEKHKKSSKL